jgi:hypothetical protein
LTNREEMASGNLRPRAAGGAGAGRQGARVARSRGSRYRPRLC